MNSLHTPSHTHLHLNCRLSSSFPGKCCAQSWGPGLMPAMCPLLPFLGHKVHVHSYNRHSAFCKSGTQEVVNKTTKSLDTEQLHAHTMHTNTQRGRGNCVWCVHVSAGVCLFGVGDTLGEWRWLWGSVSKALVGGRRLREAGCSGG